MTKNQRFVRFIMYGSITRPTLPVAYEWHYRSDATHFTNFIFTALHWMQGGLVRRTLSVRPSVCLPASQTRALWQNERNVYPHYYTTWKIVRLLNKIVVVDVVSLRVLGRAGQ